MTQEPKEESLAEAVARKVIANEAITVAIGAIGAVTAAIGVVIGVIGVGLAAGEAIASAAG